MQAAAETRAHPDPGSLPLPPGTGEGIGATAATDPSPDPSPAPAPGPPRMHRRLLALVFPRLATERWLRRGAPGGLLAVAGPPHAPEIACMTPEAAAAGIRRGMRLADARAIVPALVTRPADPAEDARLLRQLARWATHYTPLAAPQEPDAVLLDTTGAAHLFGGEAAVMAETVARLADLGLTAEAGLADTPGAALALARFAPGTVAAPGATFRAIGELPVEAAGLDPAACATLRSLGLSTLAEAVRLPRAGFARRFGVQALGVLDRLIGAAPAPISPMQTERPFAASLSFPDPIGLAADVMAGLERLLAQLCARLDTAHRGARSLRLTLVRADRESVHLDVALARPSRDPALIARLFARHVEAADAGYGIDRLRLLATRTEPLVPAQQGGARDKAGEDALALMLGTLGNRVGFDRVTRFLPAESHIPERAFTTAAAAYSEPGRWPTGGPARPLAMFPPEPLAVEAGGKPPRAFRWRRRSLRLAAAAGPERIAPEWWLDDPAWRDGPRDYWQVETAEGLRLWLFLTPLTGAWNVQGLFA